MKFTAAWLVCLAFGVMSCAQTKCFVNDGLKETHTAEFTITGNRVSGWYSARTDETYTDDNTKNYEFSGTRAGNKLTISFSGNQKPNRMPKGKNWVWTLVPAAGGKELLRLNIYGRNYETNRYSIYPVDFSACVNRWTGGAQRVSFVRGATSAKVTVSDAKPAFLINVRKGQFIGVFAPGYAIRIYYPNGDLDAYAETGNPLKNQTSALDHTGSDAVPASGDALVLLEKAPAGAEPGTAIFIVENTAEGLEKALQQVIETSLSGNN